MDPFKILGVGRDATRAQIEQAYRQQAMKHHPDRGGDAWAFQQVREAYEQIVGGSGESADVTAPPDASSYGGPVADSAAAPNTSTPASRQWSDLLRRQLPLQNETTIFILVNVLDIYMTYVLLRMGDAEANPIARSILSRWGFDAVVFFKMGLVAFVCCVTQVIALRNPKTAQRILLFGIIVVAAVVAYGASLLMRHF